MHNSTLDTIYPREATILAAVCACIFSAVGVLGEAIYFIYIFFNKIKSNLTEMRNYNNPILIYN